MLELLHIHFNFLCRSGRSNKKGQSPIVLRVIYREQRRDLYTGLYCLSNDWDPIAGRVKLRSKQAETINKNLEMVNYQALNVFDQLKYSRTPFSIDELVERLKGKEDAPILLVEYLEERNKELSKKVGFAITPATYEKYERTYRFVRNFMEEEFKVKNYSLVRIDNRFLEGFFQYLLAVRKIGNNTAVKYITFLRTLLMPAIESGTIRTNPFKKVKFRINLSPYKNILF